MKTIKWVTLDSEDGSSSLKQNGFIPMERKRKFTLEPYTGNVSLCGSIYHGNDSEENEDFDRIEGEKVIRQDVCKRCYNKFQKMQPPTDKIS